MHPFADEARIIASFLIDETPIEALPKADAIFAFGHSQPNTPLHASGLYRQGLASWLIVTGSTGFRGLPLPPEFETQADFFVNVAVQNGVPTEAILRDRKSRHTLDNVLLGMEAARKAGLEINSLILCAIPMHLRRCRATFAKQFPDITTYGSAFAWDESAWLNDQKIGRLVGEVDRLINYAEKGDTAPVLIPEEVLTACDVIRDKVEVN